MSAAGNGKTAGDRRIVGNRSVICRRDIRESSGGPDTQRGDRSPRNNKHSPSRKLLPPQTSPVRRAFPRRHHVGRHRRRRTDRRDGDGERYGERRCVTFELDPSEPTVRRRVLYHDRYATILGLYYPHKILKTRFFYSDPMSCPRLLPVPKP